MDMMDTNDSATFPYIAQMLEKVQKEFECGEFNSMIECLKNHLRINKYYPMLQLKPIFYSNGLVLLHNTYKRTDIDHFKDLYDSARSVVINMNAPIGQNIIVSLAEKIPNRITIGEYKNVMCDTDICEKGYEGTMIYTFQHNDIWHFTTSTIPDINCSRYFHPTKTHGQMFDEVLASYFNDSAYNSETLRDKFCENLSADKTYCFLLVHHENSHLMNYTEEFGKNYAVLFHLFTRDKITKGTVTDYTCKLINVGVKYPVYIKNEDIEDIIEDQNVYAVIARTYKGDTYKICNNKIIEKEDKDRGNSNIWVNIVSVYMQRRPDYEVKDYILEYCPQNKELLEIKDDIGREYNPTYIVHEVIRNICEHIYKHYRETTHYNKYTTRYNMNRELDNALPPIIRFHLALLRNIQITTHKHAPITPKTVRDYICFHQSMKNIRLLVAHFNKVYAGNPKTQKNKAAYCFLFLNHMLIG
jgi:hypothetical protein